VTALILGVAAAAWFGWGNAQPLPGLAAGSVLGVAAAIAGGWYARRLRSTGSAMADRRVRRGYGITVGVEVAAIVAGAAVLEGSGRPAYLPAWILLVVGVHFIPLGRIFRIEALGWAGLALILVAAAAAVTGAATGVPPSTVAGAGGGLVCLGCAAACLRGLPGRARTARPEPPGTGRVREP
jgi:hypothetical protein